MPQGRIVAVTNHKGGVAKTAVTVGWAHALATGTPGRHRPQRVLVIDADPQANTTSRLGTDPDEPDPRELPGLGEVLTTGTAVSDVIVGTTWDRLDLLPAGNLTGIDAHLAARPVGITALRKALTPVTGVYDWILIDTKPAQSESVQAALVAADLAVAPCPVVSKDAVDGIADLNALIDALTETGIPTARFAGVIASIHPGTAKARVALDAVGEWYPILGEVRQRPLWVDAEALRVPPQALARPGSRQALELASEFDAITTAVKKIRLRQGRP